MERLIAIFGEAEKGQFLSSYQCKSLEELAHHLGDPPEDSKGLFLAVQTLLYNYDVLYFRVEEEGFSPNAYLHGLNYLQEQKIYIEALAVPGVSDRKILERASCVCSLHQSILISSEIDLYDCLTG